MESHLFFSQLVLFALIWLFIILHLPWSQRAVTVPAAPAQPEPLTPKRPHSNEPPPFAGLTHKPHCALCERDTAYPKPPSPVPPEPIPPTNRRPRAVATSRHFCPHAGCDYRGWLGLGNLRANGHPSGGPWRQFYCTSCKGCVFHGFLPPSPSEGCHSVHVNAATQSTGCLPPSPRERCHVDHGKVATHARRSLPLSEQRDAGALLLV
jgi:hypothetical protein